MFMEEVGPGHSAGGSAPNAAPAADAAGHAGAPPPPLVHADAAPDHDRRDYGTQDAGAGSGAFLAGGGLARCCRVPVCLVAFVPAC